MYLWIRTWTSWKVASVRNARWLKSATTKKMSNMLPHGIEKRKQEGMGFGLLATKDFKKGSFRIPYGIVTRFVNNDDDSCSWNAIRIDHDVYGEVDVDVDPRKGVFANDGTVTIDMDLVTSRVMGIKRTGVSANVKAEFDVETSACVRKKEVHLFLVPTRDIKAGEWLSFEYGKREKDSKECLHLPQD